jgi:hypothetical protein
MILPVWGWFAFCALFLAFAVDALVRGSGGMGWLLLAVASGCLLVGIVRAYGTARGRKPRMLSLDLTGWWGRQPGQQGEDDGHDQQPSAVQGARQLPDRRADGVSPRTSGRRLLVASLVALVLLGLVYWQARSAGVARLWSWLATGIVAVAVAIGMIVAVRRGR